MKFLAFILAFLVLALSIMPCADIAIKSNEGNEKIELTKTGNHQNEKQPDDCTPFCICSCCAGFSINHFIAKVFTPHIILSADYVSEFSSATFAISLPIWQPPQLV